MPIVIYNLTLVFMNTRVITVFTVTAITVVVIRSSSSHRHLVGRFVAVARPRRRAHGHFVHSHSRVLYFVHLHTVCVPVIDGARGRASTVPVAASACVLQSS